MKSTYTPKAKEVITGWRHIDAQGKLLGEVATEVAKILTGKDKATYTPHINMGDKVVVTNVENLAFTGTKLENKKYFWHTGFPGGIRSETLGQKMARKPDEVLRLAVKGMLPKNKLQKVRLANLYIYKGAEHPHEAHIK